MTQEKRYVLTERERAYLFEQIGKIGTGAQTYEMMRFLHTGLVELAPEKPKVETKSTKETPNKKKG